MARWRPLEDYSPLAQLLVHYMWEQRPPLLPAQFADKVMVSRQAIARILNQDANPEPAVLLRIARVLDIPTQHLFHLAGYTTDADPLYRDTEAWDMVRIAIQQAEGLSEEERASALAVLTQVQSQDHLEVHREGSVLDDLESGTEEP